MGAAGQGFEHDWDGSLQSQMWVDFAFRLGVNSGAPNLTQAQATFIANNYAIVSLEKCLGTPHNNTIAMFDDWAVRLKAIRPELKVLFYWATPDLNRGCYAGPTGTLEANPAWWVRDDAGKVVTNPSGFYLNDSVAEERDWWVSVAAARTHADGYFADSAGWPLWHGVSDARRGQAAKGMMAKLDALRKAVAPRTVIGNTLTAYPSKPDFDMQFLDHLDGACAEHVAAFEQVLAHQPAALNVTRTAGLLSRMWTAAHGLNKTVLARTWPGPVTQPIDNLGPSWPQDTPTTAEGRAAAAAKWVDWAASLYLTIATERVFWSYNWWYNADSGVFPCAPGDCEAPQGWYEVTKRSPGAPIGPAVRFTAEGQRVAELGSAQDLATPGDAAPVYRRSFTNVNVTLDLSTMSAHLDWTD